MPCRRHFFCLQLGGFAFIGEGIPIGLGAAFKIKYKKVCVAIIAPARTAKLTVAGMASY